MNFLLTTEIGENISSKYSMSTIWDFDNIENKHEKVEKCLYFFKITCYKFWKEKNAAVNKKELKLHQDATAYNIWEKRFSKRFSKNKNYRKFRDYCHFTGK